MMSDSFYTDRVQWRHDEGSSIMKPNRTRLLTCWLLAGAVLVGMAVSLSAQPDQPRKYERFDFDPDVAKMLRDRLQAEKDLGPLKDILKDIAKDPSKFKLDPKQIEDLKKKNPGLEKAVKDLVKNNPDLQKSLKQFAEQKPPVNQPVEVKKLQDDLKKFFEEQKAKKDVPPLPKDVPAPPLPPPSPPKLKKIDAPPAPKPDPVAKTAQNLMKKTENTKLGDWLKDSPAWKRAYDDLQNSMKADTAKKTTGLLDKLQPGDGKWWKLGEGVVERMQKLPRPNFERVGPPLPGLGNFRAPNLAPPPMPDPGGPALPTIGAGLAWLLLLILLLLLAWILYRWSRRADAENAVDVRRGLGPWPVRPEEVATRTELVQAFDYLALLTLGSDVQCWNHHAVARRWREASSSCAASAQTLALLYEQARYTEGADALPAPQREQARQSLLQIAEVL